jgi:hypothetical protein
MTVIVNCIHAVSDMMGITCQKFMRRLRRPCTCVPQCEQIMSALYFLKKLDVGCHGGDGLLDTMDARSRADGAHTFVNIPGSDAKFHAAWRCDVNRIIGRNIGLDVSDFEDLALPR